MKIKISVIIPIYNVEDYIKECLESVINQTMRSIEIILVNDGSTDASIDKIKDIIHENSNIYLIEKENGGLSSARNAGLKYAKGEYISFIDSDDFIEPKFLENLYKIAVKNDLDIVVSNYTKLFDNGKKIKIKRNQELLETKIISGKDFLLKQLIIEDYRMEVWSNLYKRALLVENKLSFEEKIIHEDEEFTPRVLLAAKRVQLINKHEYIYRQRANSLVNIKPNINHVKSLEYILNNLISEFNNTEDKTTKIIITKLTIRIYHNYILKKIMVENKRIYKLNSNEKKYFNIMHYNNILGVKDQLKIYIIKCFPKMYIKRIEKLYKNK